MEFATLVTPLARMSLGYAETITKDIPPERFGRRPDGVAANTPAWCLGHLSIYPERCLELVGREDLVDRDERFEEIFENGTEAIDDADGSHYPAKDAILERYARRHEALLEVLPSVDPAVFNAPLPNERMRQRFPSIGHLLAFLMGSHAMLHLGQVSTWRRCEGLGPAM